jgi:aminomethyltransferase
MVRHAPPSVTVVDETREVSLLALQGPRAEAIMGEMGLSLTELPYFGFGQVQLGGGQVLVSRTGYTGEDGFELFVASAQAPGLWRGILAAGSSLGLLPCGLGARDACRLEAGLRLYGQDMDEDSNPYDAGLGWTVRLSKGEFIGSAALAKIKARGARLKMVGLVSEDRAIPRHGTPVRVGGDETGHVTSGTFSFFLNQGIAMASVPLGAAAAGDRVEFVIRGQNSMAKVVPLPIYRGSVRSPAATKA